MDKYIEYEDIQECRFFQDEEGEWILHADIIKIPAADVAPVVHGKWIFYEVTDLIERCSLCGEQKPSPMFYHTNYCPNCGAKMDGDGE